MNHRRSLMSVNYHTQQLGKNSLMLLGNQSTMIDIVGNGRTKRVQEHAQKALDL